jgi:hypothetical protein
MEDERQVVWSLAELAITDTFCRRGDLTHGSDGVGSRRLPKLQDQKWKK